MTLQRGGGSLYGLLMLLLMAPGIAQAHNPYALSLRLHQTPAGSYLEVIAPTPGVQAAFTRRFADSGDVPLDSIEGKQRIVQYVKDTVALTTPEGPVTLGKGLLRVDGRQVFLRLEVAGAEGALFPLQVHAPCLAENPGELVTFRLISSVGSARVLLTEDSDFSATLKIGPEGEVQVARPSPSKAKKPSPPAGEATGPAQGKTK